MRSDIAHSLLAFAFLMAVCFGSFVLPNSKQAWNNRRVRAWRHDARWAAYDRGKERGRQLSAAQLDQAWRDGYEQGASEEHEQWMRADSHVVIPDNQMITVPGWEPAPSDQIAIDARYYETPAPASASGPRQVGAGAGPGSPGPAGIAARIAGDGLTPFDSAPAAATGPGDQGPGSESSGTTGLAPVPDPVPDLTDHPDILIWDARANAARCSEIVGELRDLKASLASWRPTLTGWSDAA